MAALPVVGRSDVLHPPGVGRKLVALAETAAARVVRIVNRDRVPAALVHQREAGHVGRPVTDVDHVLEGHRPQVGRHVVVHILVMLQHALVDAEQELGLRRVRDRPLRKADVALRILAELAAEDRLHLRRQPAAVEQRLEAGGNDVELDLHPRQLVVVPERGGRQRVEDLRHPRVEVEARAELRQPRVADAVHLQVVEQALQVGQLAVPLLLGDQRVALLPELRRIDPELRKQHVVLHVARTQRLVVVEDQRDGVLGSCHGAAKRQPAAPPPRKRNCRRGQEGRGPRAARTRQDRQTKGEPARCQFRRGLEAKPADGRLVTASYSPIPVTFTRPKRRGLPVLVSSTVTRSQSALMNWTLSGPAKSTQPCAPPSWRVLENWGV